MTTQAKPIVTIVHALPGRVRLRLSHAPVDENRMCAAIREHEGLLSVAYTPATRSVLVCYTPTVVQHEEIVLRVAVAMSLEYGAIPVRLLAEPERQDLSPAAGWSALALTVALASRWLQSGANATRLDWPAGILTALAVADHGWKEVKEKGNFDPEVLSLGYLLTSFFRGSFVYASVVTWLMTFGRHLVKVPQPGVVVRPIKASGPGEEARYEVVVGPDAEAPRGVRAVGAAQSLIRHVLAGDVPHGRRGLFDELKSVSKMHGETLEGMAWMPKGMSMRFR